LVDPLLVSPPPARPPFPGLARLGMVVMAFGLLLDLVEHGFVSHVQEQTVAGFPLSEHAAHLVVLVGMVQILVGIVHVGISIGRQPTTQNRSIRHAVR
jgi:ATP/ADP translocase